MNLNYDVIIIGWGKAGKTLAKTFAKRGQKVAIIEKTKTMAGGSCINVACIPTKMLAAAAAAGELYETAFARRNQVVQQLNARSFENLAKEDTVDIFFGEGSFKNDEVILVRMGEEVLELTGKLIMINTGSTPVIPDIPGLKESKRVYDSESIQKLPELPQRLGILGAGTSGMEFASNYADFGAEVTLIESGVRLLKQHEPEIQKAVLDRLVEQGIDILYQTKIVEVRDCENGSIEAITQNGRVLTFDALLMAVGRKPNIAGLAIKNTSLCLNDKGGIETNPYLRTSVDHIFALGDVRGYEQFTYTSLDDARIVLDYLLGEQHYSLDDRHQLPTALFINPPLAKVGMTESEARKAGLEVRCKVLPVAQMPRARVIGKMAGVFKAVIEQGTNRILGASLFGPEAHELINIIGLAMECHIPATTLKNKIFTHPTMAENLNDLFE